MTPPKTPPPSTRPGGPANDPPVSPDYRSDPEAFAASLWTDDGWLDDLAEPPPAPPVEPGLLPALVVHLRALLETQPATLAVPVAFDDVFPLRPDLAEALVLLASWNLMALDGVGAWRRRRSGYSHAWSAAWQLCQDHGWTPADVQAAFEGPLREQLDPDQGALADLRRQTRGDVQLAAAASVGDADGAPGPVTVPVYGGPGGRVTLEFQRLLDGRVRVRVDAGALEWLVDQALDLWFHEVNDRGERREIHHHRWTESESRPAFLDHLPANLHVVAALEGTLAP